MDSKSSQMFKHTNKIVFDIYFRSFRLPTLYFCLSIVILFNAWENNSHFHCSIVIRQNCPIRNYERTKIIQICEFGSLNEEYSHKMAVYKENVFHAFNKRCTKDNNCNIIILIANLFCLFFHYFTPSQ